MTNSRIDSKQKQVKTSKNTFLLHRWGVRTSLSNMTYFGKTLGIPFTQAISQGENGFMEALPQALMLLFHNLEEETSIDDFLDRLLDGVTSLKTNQPVDIEQDFYDPKTQEDDLGEIIELCVVVFKSRYGSLLAKKVLESFTEMGAGMSALQDS